MSTIEIKGLNKSFGKKQALYGIDLTLRENCIYGLLGRNGAGKTTLMNIITNRLFADSGEVKLDGVSASENDAVLSKMHMMSEQSLYNPDLKVKEMFRAAAFFYKDYDMEYAMKLCGEYKLDPGKKLGRLSTGYRTVAKIINALACGAEAVFFDEPVLGLDAGHRDMFYRQTLDRFNAHPATYVISTHLIEEAAGLIERAAVIKEGRLILDEDVENIRMMGYCVSGKAADVDKFTAGKDVMSEESMGMLKSAYIKGSRQETDIPPELEVSSMSLQAMFINLTNS